MTDPHAPIAAVERARIGIAHRLSGSAFDDDTAAEFARWVTDSLIADGWKAPGATTPTPPPWREHVIATPLTDDYRRARAQLGTNDQEYSDD